MLMLSLSPQLLHAKEKVFQRRKEQLLCCWSDSSSDSEDCSWSHGELVMVGAATGH